MAFWYTYAIPSWEVELGEIEDEIVRLFGGHALRGAVLKLRRIEEARVQRVPELHMAAEFACIEIVVDQRRILFFLALVNENSDMGKFRKGGNEFQVAAPAGAASFNRFFLDFGHFNLPNIF